MPRDRENTRKEKKGGDSLEVGEDDSNLQSFPRRRELYERGLTDQQIADEVGVSRQAIIGWRNQRDLPPNQNKNLSPEEESERKELYEDGLNDQQIADEVGVSRAAIRSWRLRKDLPPNRENKKVDYRKLLRLEGDGWSSGYESVDRLLKHLARKTKSEESRKSYCSVLGRFCDFFGKKPNQIVKIDRETLEKMLERFLDDCKSNSTSEDYKYKLKTFFKVNKRENIYYPKYETIARVYERPEYIPYLDEALKLMNYAPNLKAKALIGVIFTGGLRPSAVRAIRYGIDSERPQLKVSTVKEEIESGKKNLLINVFLGMKKWVDPACKNKLPHYTFIAEFATEAVKDYLEDRKREHGPISEEEFLFPSGNNRLPREERVLKPLSGNTPNKIVKRAAKKAQIEDWKAVTATSLRKVFDNTLKDCREIPDEDKEFWMGHKIPGSREAYYDSSKTEKMREKYRKVNFHPQSRFEQEEFLRKIASFHGLDYDEVMEEAREIFGGEIDQEKAKKHLRWKIDDRKKSRKKQEIICEGELQEHLDAGYEVECELSDGRFIVSKEESILDLLEGGGGEGKIPS